MILISHRANFEGPDPSFENSPEKISHAISNNISVEIDIRLHKNEFYLGHDEPQYQTSLSFLLENKSYLWIHCKDKESFGELLKIYELNCFWHQNDDYTLTSHGYIWAYPGKEPTGRNCIAVMPEYCWTLENVISKQFWGICSDHITQIQNIINKT